MAVLPSRRFRRESGQAAVEAALTLPLNLFIILGTLQLSMMLQARVMAHYAAYKATRAGSVNFGDCVKMTDAAVASLLPAYSSYLGPATAGGTPGQKLAKAWSVRAAGANRNKYDPSLQYDNGQSGDVVWIFREEPTQAGVLATGTQDIEFDNPLKGLNQEPKRLEVRLVFWYPMHIPFANWVISKMYLAYFGIQTYTYSNPLMPAQANANWTNASAAQAALGAHAAQIINEFKTRNLAGQYVFPIEASYTMRMMTPAKASKFATQDCPPAP